MWYTCDTREALGAVQQHGGMTRALMADRC
jgi:hypothetical protein